MSLTTINELITKFCDYTQLNKDDIKVKSVVFDDTNTYTIEIIIDNNIYNILHFEPIKMVQGGDYGMGHNHCYYIYDESQKFFVNYKK